MAKMAKLAISIFLIVCVMPELLKCQKLTYISWISSHFVRNCQNCQFCQCKFLY